MFTTVVAVAGSGASSYDHRDREIAVFTRGPTPFAPLSRMAETTVHTLIDALKAVMVEVRAETDAGYEQHGRKYQDPETEGPQRGDTESDFYRAIRLAIARLWGAMLTRVHDDRLESLGLAEFRERLAEVFESVNFIAIRAECGESATPQLSILRDRLAELARTGEAATIDATAERAAYFADVPTFAPDDDIAPEHTPRTSVHH